MSLTIIGIIGFIFLFLLMALRMPIGFALGLVGFLGLCFISGIDAALPVLARTPYSSASSYSLSIIALFVLMGEITFHSGVSQDLYKAANAWLGHWRGGLAVATVAACAGFASICGSSVATAVTIGKIALPEMKRSNYDASLATGCVAAGGTIGILIPPSVGFVVYAILAEQSIGKLFMAGIIPGVLLTLLFFLTIFVVVRRNPRLGPAGVKASYKERFRSLKSVWAVAVLAIIILGGIYSGVFSPNEAAGIGAFIALLIGLARGLSKQSIYASLMETIETTAMIFIILIGATIFSHFVALTRIPFELVGIVGGQLSPLALMIAIIILYVILGCVLDTLGMLVITLPVILPLVSSAGYDLIWFGVVVVVLIEQAMITPPVGINVFAIAGIAKDVPMHTIFRGIMPFWVAMIVCLAFLIAFPQIALFLPSTMR